MKEIAAVILAAGKGTRMKSDLVKVLHPLLGVPMLSYTIDLALDGIAAEKTAVVVGHQADRIQDLFKDRSVQFVLQKDNSAAVTLYCKPFHFLEHQRDRVDPLRGPSPGQG